MKTNHIDFLGIPVSVLTMNETISLVETAIREGQNLQHVVINAGKVVSMQKDKELFNSVVSSDIINADGQSIVWAARILGEYLPGRVTGIDLMEELVQLAAKKNYKCYFLGACEDVLKKVVAVYTNKYGSSIIAGSHNGYFTIEEDCVIAQKIAESGAQMLFVAISSPRKENFLSVNRVALSKVNFTMGVGGSFDVIAGITKRAPLWIQQIGMEWFYRFIQEPRRMFKRYLVGNSEFIRLVLAEKLTKKRAKVHA